MAWREMIHLLLLAVVMAALATAVIKFAVESF
jgi:hypothetical protein